MLLFSKFYFRTYFTSTFTDEIHLAADVKHFMFPWTSGCAFHCFSPRSECRLPTVQIHFVIFCRWLVRKTALTCRHLLKRGLLIGFKSVNIVGWPDSGLNKGPLLRVVQYDQECIRVYHRNWWLYKPCSKRDPSFLILYIWLSIDRWAVCLLHKHQHTYFHRIEHLPRPLVIPKSGTSKHLLPFLLYHLLPWLPIQVLTF